MNKEVQKDPETLALQEALKIDPQTCYYEFLAQTNDGGENVSVLGLTENENIIDLAKKLACRQIIASNGQCVLPNTTEIREYLDYLVQKELIPSDEEIVWVDENDYLNPPKVLEAIKEEGYKNVLCYEWNPELKELVKDKDLTLEQAGGAENQKPLKNKTSFRNMFTQERKIECPYPRITFNGEQWGNYVGERKPQEINDSVVKQILLDWFSEQGNPFTKEENVQAFCMVQQAEGDGGMGNIVIYRNGEGKYYKKEENMFEEIDFLPFIKTFADGNSVEITPHLNPKFEEDTFASGSTNFYIHEGKFYKIPFLNYQLTDEKGDYTGATSINSGTAQENLSSLLKEDKNKIENFLQQLLNMGYKGWGGIDFHAFLTGKTEKEWEYFPTEMNPRFTGISQLMRFIINKSPQTFKKLVTGIYHYIDADHLHLPEGVTNLEEVIQLLEEKGIPLWSVKNDRGVIIKGVPSTDGQIQISFVGEKNNIIEWYRCIDPENAQKFFPDQVNELMNKS